MLLVDSLSPLLSLLSLSTFSLFFLPCRVSAVAVSRPSLHGQLSY